MSQARNFNVQADVKFWERAVYCVLFEVLFTASLQLKAWLLLQVYWHEGVVFVWHEHISTSVLLSITKDSSTGRRGPRADQDDWPQHPSVWHGSTVSADVVYAHSECSLLHAACRAADGRSRCWHSGDYVGWPLPQVYLVSWCVHTWQAGWQQAHAWASWLSWLNGRLSSATSTWVSGMAVQLLFLQCCLCFIIDKFVVEYDTVVIIIIIIIIVVIITETPVMCKQF